MTYPFWKPTVVWGETAVLRTLITELFNELFSGTKTNRKVN